MKRGERQDMILFRILRENEMGQNLGENFVNPAFSRKILRQKPYLLYTVFCSASLSQDFSTNESSITEQGAEDF